MLCQDRMCALLLPCILQEPRCDNNIIIIIIDIGRERVGLMPCLQVICKRFLS